LDTALGATWSPDDRQILVARMGRAEIWDVETATSTATMPFGAELESDVIPLWLDAGPLLIEGVHITGDWNIWTWVDGQQIVTSIDGNSNNKAVIDPAGRWIFWPRNPHDPERWNVVGLRGEVSRLNEPRPGDDDEALGGEIRHGSWSSFGGVTYWVSTIERIEPGSKWVGWEALVIDDSPARHEELVREADAEWLSLDVDFAAPAAGGEPIPFGELVNDDTTQAIGPPPPQGCKFVDLGPGGASALLECGDHYRFDCNGQSFALPSTVQNVEWSWAGSGWFVLDGDRRLMVFGADSMTPAFIRDVHEWMLLAADRLLLLSPTGVELIAFDGKPTTVFELPRATFSDASLSPTGELLALIDDGQLVRVFAPPEQRPIAEWTAPEADTEVAFRADGAVLFTGDGSPRHAFDPRTGQAVDVLAPVLRATKGKLVASDASWRWIMLPEQGEIVRTLDGARLDFVRGYLPETGRYRDQPPLELRVRFADPREVEVFSAAELEPWLHDPKLFERFFADEPLPPVRLTTAERAQLRQRVGR
jgi:hypothetical protein